MEKSEIAALISSALDDAKRLVALEAKLLRMELYSLGARTRRVALYVAIALGLAVPSAVMAFLALGVALHTWTDLSPWLCYALVAAVGSCVSLFLVWRAQVLWQQSKVEWKNGTESRTVTAGNRSHSPVVAE